MDFVDSALEHYSYFIVVEFEQVFANRLVKFQSKSVLASRVVNFQFFERIF